MTMEREPRFNPVLVLFAPQDLGEWESSIAELRRGAWSPCWRSPFGLIAIFPDSSDLEGETIRDLANKYERKLEDSKVCGVLAEISST